MNDADFRKVQREFTRYLREPSNYPIPHGIEERRIAVYRDGVFANIEGFMSDNFPRIKAIMARQDWLAMVRDYFANHRAGASLFVELPQEFLDYLSDERRAANDPPFLVELAHFDWLETLVGADQRRIDMTGVDPDGDLLTEPPVLNPVLRMITYEYPVHAINADYQPTEPPPTPTVIAAFRDRENKYGFLDLNRATAWVIELLQADPDLTGRTVLEHVAVRLSHSDPAAVVSGGIAILERMRASHAVLGTRRF